MKRVSARFANLNSFQKRVPTGNFHASGFEALMNLPRGSSIHRVLTAPSVQSGYCGETRIFSDHAIGLPVARTAPFLLETVRARCLTDRPGR